MATRTAMDPYPLPPAPARLVHERGVPAFGMYRGTVEQLSWRALRAPLAKQLTRQLHHKRWQCAAISHPDFFIGVAVIDTGWCGSAFAYLFDRQRRELVASFSSSGLPLISTRIENRSFGDATFRQGKDCIAFRRADGRLELTVNTPALRLAAHIALPEPHSVMAAIAPGNWLAHATHKSSALPISGYAEYADRRLLLDDASASLDAANGLLARDTTWCSARAHDHRIGFNLQQGYMGDAENAVWLDGVPHRVGAARFEFDATQPLAPWQIRTDDGAVALTFTPEGVRQQEQDLLIAASHSRQPIGCFSGRIIHPHTGVAHEVSQLLGITEEHHSRW
ncbi:DUF2804 domain-containing protein [Vogesella sp. LYT5W]|uniref:DUF2804 domain-containing protein n=1 Tax=Vogesella margarita TaxID=2984199 RepID=A0ABT5IS12_9NEIS|nr:DUF2804 domain-containing protein [Vogesella margarita]MDC7715307.1 DUF2804 domain-containing protein [Vogesella margarita]